MYVCMYVCKPKPVAQPAHPHQSACRAAGCNRSLRRSEGPPPNTEPLAACPACPVHAVVDGRRRRRRSQQCPANRLQHLLHLRRRCHGYYYCCLLSARRPSLLPCCANRFEQLGTCTNDELMQRIENEAKTRTQNNMLCLFFAPLHMLFVIYVCACVF